MARTWLPGLFGMGQARPISAYNGPRAVGLLASTSAGSFRSPVDEDLLRIVRAPKTVWVLVVISTLELAIMAVCRIAPLISGVRPSGVEAIGIRLVCVALIFAIEMAGQSRAERSSYHDTCDCRASASATMTDGIPQQPADQRAANHACGINGVVALPVE